jgi:hypothetical protein
MLADVRLYVGGTFTREGGWGVMNNGTGRDGLAQRDERLSGATMQV